MSCIHSFGHQNWNAIIFGKPLFCPGFESLVVPNWPIFKALLALRGVKIAQHGLQMASFHLFVQPKWSRIMFEKTLFDPFFDPFFVAKQPILTAFCDFGVAKMLATRSKKGSLYLFVHPKWSEIRFGKTHF